MEERMRNLEKRVESLELAQKSATEADHLQHQQMQLLRTDVQETNSLLKRLLPDVGTSREKLDALEHGQQELKQILQQNYDAILDAMVKTVKDENKEHIEQLEKTLATKDDLEATKREILDAVRNISSPGKN
jgi:phage-related tail protein